MSERYLAALVEPREVGAEVAHDALWIRMLNKYTVGTEVGERFHVRVGEIARATPEFDAEVYDTGFLPRVAEIYEAPDPEVRRRSFLDPREYMRATMLGSKRTTTLHQKLYIAAKNLDIMFDQQVMGPTEFRTFFLARYAKQLQRGDRLKFTDLYELEWGSDGTDIVTERFPFDGQTTTR